MKYRKLRIAWSVVFGLLCLLLIALWVRTAHNGDNFQEPSLEVQGVAVYSTDGIIWAVKAPFVTISSTTGFNVSYYIPSRYQYTPDGYASTAIHKGRGFDMKFWSRSSWFIQAPNWFPVLVTVALGVAPWINRMRQFRQFSLRTLLTAMTVAAIGLGWIVYVFK